MRALGLHILLSPDFQQQEGTRFDRVLRLVLLIFNFSSLVDSLLSRIDTIQKRAGLVNLEYGNVTATFQKNCNLVSNARANHRAEAHLEAAAVATCDQCEDDAEAEPYVAANLGVSKANFEEMVLAHEAEDCTDWTCD